MKIPCLLLALSLCAGVRAQSCTGTAVLAVTVETCSGSYEPETPGFQLFPNPARQWIEIRSESGAGAFRIFDAFGRLVKEAAVEDAVRIDTESWPVGLYRVLWQNTSLRRLTHRTFTIFP